MGTCLTTVLNILDLGMGPKPPQVRVFLFFTEHGLPPKTFVVSLSPFVVNFVFFVINLPPFVINLPTFVVNLVIFAIDLLTFVMNHTFSCNDELVRDDSFVSECSDDHTRVSNVLYGFRCDVSSLGPELWLR